MQKQKVQIKQLPKTDVIVITQVGDPHLFITSNNGLIISKTGLLNLIKVLITTGFIHEKSIKGLLEEINTL